MAPDKPKMSLDELLTHNAQRAGGSRIIEYGGLKCIAPLNEIQQGIALLMAAGDARPALIAEVNRCLKRSMRSVKRHKASQQVAMNWAQDVAIWFANEVIEGRASLEVN